MTAKEYYIKAKKLGMKNFRVRSSRGEYPYLQVLDEILSYTETVREEKIGLVDIPLEQIVGTKSRGRTNAFASNFMPLMEENTEFASKWMSLYQAHLDEGIRDPIVAYEFMNHYYVMEGNKRVSVMKYFKASSIPGVVTRIIPKKNDSKESQIYYEYLDFYKITNINFLNFTQVGSFPKLLKYVSPENTKIWDEDMCTDLRTAYYRFEDIFKDKAAGKRMPLTASDAFLIYLDYYGYEHFFEKTQKELKDEITKLWEDFLLFPNKRKLNLKMDSGQMDSSKSNMLGSLRMANTKLKIAFINDKSPDTSKWVYMHDLGRKTIEEEFGNRISVSVYNHVSLTKQGIEAMKDAIEKGCTLIFVTTPNLIKACISIAVKYPNVKILNCSLSTCYGHIRTYYGRLYEAKFLMGALAGIMTKSNDIGYLADYPIAGAIANINAFALGVKMINPDAKIHLHWYAKKDENVELWNENVSIISGYDSMIPNSDGMRFGIYEANSNEGKPLAMPVWEWGSFYSKIVHSVFNNTWKKDSLKTKDAINYWWGMSSGMIDILVSGQIPSRVKFLIETLKKAVQQDFMHPFEGEIYDQDGNLKNQNGEVMDPNDIMWMDWLVDNVVGTIPNRDELIDSAKTVVEIQGVKKGDRSTQ
jgi:basic membrane lipoprotein Med (substrate-binding protein (PBP1-ABC) superfamily)